MNAPARFPATPALAAPLGTDIGLTDEEMAELAREDAEADWREEVAEYAHHCRAYAEGDWDLDDYLEWSPVGRGLAAAHARSVAGMVGEGSAPHALPGVV